MCQRLSDIGELFNKYFTSIVAAHDNEADFTTSPLNTTNENILSKLVLSPDDVLAALLNLDTNKATGPDGISPRLLTETAHQIAPSESKAMLYYWICLRHLTKLITLS